MKPRSVFLGGVILEGGLVLVAVILGYLLAGQPLLNPIRLDLDGLATGLAATLPMVAYFVFSLSRFGRNIAGFQRVYRILREILSKAIIELPGWKLVVLGMSAGIGEECLFRGVLQPLFEGWLPGVNSILTPEVNAILVTGIIFGLLHALTPTYFIIATLLSIYCGFLVNYTGNLLTPVLAHGLYDAIGFLLLKRMFVQEAPPAVQSVDENPVPNETPDKEPPAPPAD